MLDKKYYVYKATNLVNGKSYIGQSSQPHKRIWQHWRCYEKERCVFHDAIEKFGYENFKWEILETASSCEEAVLLEKYYIKQFSTLYPNGYNMNKGGVGGHNARPVVCLSLDGEFVKRYDSAADAELDGFNNVNVLLNCKNKLHSCKGHLFMFEDEYKANGPKQYEKPVAWNAKRIVQCDKNGNYIETFDSVSDASSKTGIRRPLISSVLTMRSKHAGGYIFVYETDYPIKNISKYKANKKGVQIAQIDPEKREIVAIYDRVADAGRALGVNYKSIHKVLDVPMRRAFGYEWKRI